MAKHQKTIPTEIETRAKFGGFCLLRLRNEKLAKWQIRNIQLARQKSRVMALLDLGPAQVGADTKNPGLAAGSG